MRVDYILALNLLLTYTLASILIKNNNKINQTMCVEIKQRLIDVCSWLQQNIVDSVVSKLRKHLWACVHAQARHFEHLL